MVSQTERQAGNLSFAFSNKDRYSSGCMTHDAYDGGGLGVVAKWSSRKVDTTCAKLGMRHVSRELCVLGRNTSRIQVLCYDT